MVRDEEYFWLRLNQDMSIENSRAQDKAIATLVESDEKFATNLERRRAIRCAVFDARQGVRNRSNIVKGNRAKTSRRSPRRLVRALPNTPHGPLHRVVRCHSQLILRNVEGAMKHAKDVHISLFLDQVGDAELIVMEDADVARGLEEAVPQIRILGKNLSAFEYPLDGSARRIGIVSRDVLEDVLEPAECFVRPGYLRHDRIRRPISSFEMVRRASESARPR